jgi:hypothetical protein
MSRKAPVSSRELWERNKHRLEPGIRSEIEAMLADDLIEISEGDKRPDCIVGGLNPAEFIVGSRREKCAACGAFVWLAPESGMAMLERFPGVPVLCYPCASAGNG